jgi:hypothetical protein
VSIFKTTYVMTGMNRIEELDRCLKACKTELSLLMSQDTPAPEELPTANFDVEIDFRVDTHGNSTYKNPGVYKLVTGKESFTGCEAALEKVQCTVLVEGGAWKIQVGSVMYCCKRFNIDPKRFKKKWKIYGYSYDDTRRNRFRHFAFHWGGTDFLEFIIQED